MTARATSGRTIATWAVVAALCLAYYVAATSASADKSAAYDEGLHLVGGYSYWKHGDFRLQPENGNLPQRWAAIPLVLGDTRFPSLDQLDWAMSRAPEMSDQLLFAVGNDAQRVLQRGRAMIALAGVVLGVLVFAWTRSLLGAAAGILALALFASSPTMLSNGSLATSDMVAALFFLATMGATWRALRRPAWGSVAGAGLILGGLLVSKFSAATLLPMIVLLVAVQLASRHPVVFRLGRSRRLRGRAARLLSHLTVLALQVLVAWAVVWGFYGWRFAMFADGQRTAMIDGREIVPQPEMPLERLVKNNDAVEQVVAVARRTHLLPEAYLYGFTHTYQRSQMRKAFLNGAFGIFGWPEFFPYTLLVKTPLSLFLLVGLGALALVRSCLRTPASRRARRITRGLYRSAPLWVLFVVYWAFAITSHLNIGHRHILPTYPPMLVLAGASALWLAPSAWRRPAGTGTAIDPRATFAAVLVLLGTGAAVLEAIVVWPDYLAYFNQIVGGSRHGYRHLVDSSLDWGQDLPGVRRWLQEQGLDAADAPPVYLSYFGRSPHESYGIRATLLPSFPDRWPRPATPPSEMPVPPADLLPGVYVISATMLQNVLSMMPGPWAPEYEARYWQLRRQVAAFDATRDDPAARRELLDRNGTLFWALTFWELERFRFQRLCSWLRQREPDAQIHFSMNVYRLTAADLAAALDGPPVEPR